MWAVERFAVKKPTSNPVYILPDLLRDSAALGLPPPPTLLTPETIEQHAVRLAALKLLVQRLRLVADLHVGTEAAEGLWAHPKVKKKPGRKPGRALDERRDRNLLAFYDAELARLGPRPDLPGAIAKYVFSNWKQMLEVNPEHDFGPVHMLAGAKSIEQQLRRLLKEREQAPRSLLGDAMRKS